MSGKGETETVFLTQYLWARMRVGGKGMQKRTSFRDVRELWKRAAHAARSPGGQERCRRCTTPRPGAVVLRRGDETDRRDLEGLSPVQEMRSRASPEEQAVFERFRGSGGGLLLTAACECRGRIGRD